MVNPVNSGANIRAFSQGDGLRSVFVFIYQKGSRVIKLTVCHLRKLCKTL